MSKLLIVLLTLVVVSCGQGVATPSPATNPQADLNLETVILERGDLPEDFSVTETQDTVDLSLFSELPPASTVIARKILGYNQNTANFVHVYLYEDSGEAQEAFDLLVANSPAFRKGSESIEGIGEIARIQIDPFSFHFITYERIAFTRCNALVYIDTSADTANYARRLDARLREHLC